MEKPSEKRERVNGKVCTFILSVGSLNYFDRKNPTYIADQRTITRKPKALLTKLVQRRDFTKCK